MKLKIELPDEELKFIEENNSDFEELECVYKHHIGTIPTVVKSLYKKGFLYKEYSPYDNDEWFYATNLWNYVNNQME